MKDSVSVTLLMLLPLALLQGCATQSAISATACPQLPLPPVARESAPLVPYQTSVQTLLQKWDALLKDSLSMR